MSLAETPARDATEIAVTFSYDRKIWRRAMTGWWQSVVPPAPFVSRAIFWAVVWGAVGILALALAAVGLTPWYVFAGLTGAGALVAVFAYLQRTRMSRFWDVVGGHWDKAGRMRLVFGPSGLLIDDAVSRRELNWDGVDAIAAVRGATVIRSGISMVAVPDSALPQGMDARSFRKHLEDWREAGS